MSIDKENGEEEEMTYEEQMLKEKASMFSNIGCLAIALTFAILIYTCKHL